MDFTNLDQIIPVLASLLAALGAWLGRKEGRIRNGSGKKEPAFPVVLEKLDRLGDKVDRVGERLDDHIEAHKERVK